MFVWLPRACAPAPFLWSFAVLVETSDIEHVQPVWRCIGLRKFEHGLGRGCGEGRADVLMPEGVEDAGRKPADCGQEVGERRPAAHPRDAVAAHGRLQVVELALQG